MMFENSANVHRDVALVLHAHHLAPACFERDFSNDYYSSLTGRLDFQLFRFAARLQNLYLGDENSFTAWKSMYPTYPYQVFEVAEDIYKGQTPFFARLINGHPPQGSRPQASDTNTRPKFELNLTEAIIRQWRFSEKITKCYNQDPIAVEALNHSRLRYVKFMNLMRLQNQHRTITPSLDIDLFWHTHQLSSIQYNDWCNTWLGRSIDHDDTIQEGQLSDGLEYTKQIWQQNYEEEYLGPTPIVNAYQRPTSQQSKVIYPPAQLSVTQKMLWDFDVDKQKRHQKYQYDLLQIEERYNKTGLQVLYGQLATAKTGYTKARDIWSAKFPVAVSPSQMQSQAAKIQGRQGHHQNSSSKTENRGLFKGIISAVRSGQALKEQGRVESQQKQAREAALVEAMQPWTHNINRIKANIEQHVSQAVQLTNWYSDQQAMWRLQRFSLLQQTGAIAKPSRREPGFMGSTRYVPGVDAITFPLYAANWYMVSPVGAYDYSTSFFNVSLGKEAGGYYCGSNMDGGKTSGPTVSSGLYS
jgi:hypothetical protein